MRKLAYSPLCSKFERIQQLLTPTYCPFLLPFIWLEACKLYAINLNINLNASYKREPKTTNKPLWRPTLLGVNSLAEKSDSDHLAHLALTTLHSGPPHECSSNRFITQKCTKSAATTYIQYAKLQVIIKVEKKWWHFCSHLSGNWCQGLMLKIATQIVSKAKHRKVVASTSVGAALPTTLGEVKTMTGYTKYNTHCLHTKINKSYTAALKKK